MKIKNLKIQKNNLQILIFNFHYYLFVYLFICLFAYLFILLRRPQLSQNFADLYFAEML